MKNSSKFLFGMLVVSQTFVVGCASFQMKGRVAGADGDEAKISGSEDPSKAVLANLAKPYVSPLGDIPLDVTPLTEQWLKYFQGRGRRYMEVYLQRSTRYLPMMRNTLRENGLPENLVYVALIESGFSPIAHSHANAVGYWQFIRGTGKRYGLKLDPFIDERRDPVLSTRAAAAYYTELFEMFGSWHLALAAYNVGEGRIKKSVARFRTKDFWELTKHRRAFPKETKHYVPKFIAATMIAKDPAKYGFTDIAYQDPLTFDTVQLVNPVSMSRLAAAMNTDVETLKLLNPKFRGDYVPKYRGDETVIRVPVGKREIAMAAIPNAYSPAPKVIAAEHFFYRVKRGDTLSTIARRHRTSLAQLKRLNGLGNRTLLRVGQRLKVPDRGGSLVTYEMPAYEKPADAASGALETPMAEGARTSTLASNRNLIPDDQTSRGESVEIAATPDESATPELKTEVHVVRRGENLTLIARKYGLSVAELRRLNKLNNRAVLRAGQTLRLKEEDAQPATSDNQSGRLQNSKASQPRARKIARAKVMNSDLKQDTKKKSRPARAVAQTKAKSKAKTKRHIVKRGETLADIAQRYRVSIGTIAKHNKIKNRSHVLAGAELVIPR